MSRMRIEISLDPDELVAQLSTSESKELLGALCADMSDNDILENVGEDSIVTYLEANGYKVAKEEE